MAHNLIAFTGYGRAGKDEAAKPLLQAGYQRFAFGDIIKRQLDMLILEHFGFSAFTEVDEQKTKIRRTLESWGEDNYDAILREFFKCLPCKAVNVRLCRIQEAEAWVKRGGIIVLVKRPGLKPETKWSATRVRELLASGLVHPDPLVNDGTLEQLHAKVRERFLTAPRAQ